MDCGHLRMTFRKGQSILYHHKLSCRNLKSSSVELVLTRQSVHIIKRTHIDLKLVCARLERISVVVWIKFSERRIPAGSHPNQKVFILWRIKQVISSISVRVPVGPVRRWCELFGWHWSLFVSRNVGWPSYALFTHCIGYIIFAHALWW